MDLADRDTFDDPGSRRSRRGGHIRGVVAAVWSDRALGFRYCFSASGR